MKKGIRAHDVKVEGIENIAKKCRELNIGYLQLVLEKSVSDFKFGNFTEKYATKLKEKIGDTEIAVLGSYINPSNPNIDELYADIRKFKENIKYASVLKPIVIGTETGIYMDGKTDSEEAYQYVLRTIKELVNEAERYNVFIGIEGVHCFVINTPQKMKRLIDDINSDNVKVIFDPVNYLNIRNYLNQDVVIMDVFNLLSDKICVLHAKDFIVENGEFKSVKPAEGILNYELIFKQIEERNLDIPIICEEINEKDAVFAFKKLESVTRR